MPDDMTPEVLLNQVLGKVSDVLLNGDGNVVPKSDDHFLAFMSPGIPMLEEDFDYAREGFTGVIHRSNVTEDLEKSTGPQPEDGAAAQDGPTVDQLLAQDALGKYMRAEEFTNVVDLIPDLSGIVDSNRLNTWNPEARVSKVYAMALQQSQVYDNQPDQETQQKVDRWRSKLVVTRKEKDIITDEEVEVTDDSPLVKAYNAKMQDYLTAAMEYNTMRISAMSGADQQAVHQMAINGPLLQAKVRAAMNAWSTAGHKEDYDRLAAAIASVEDRAFVLLKQRYKEDYLRSLLTNPSTGSNFPYCAPAVSSFAEAGSGWSKFWFRSGDFNSNYHFRSSKSSGGGGFTIGCFGIGGGGSSESRSWNGHVDTQNFSLEFEMCRVPISRPWFNLDFLLSGYWRFDPNNVIVANSMVSDGKEPPSGLMPAITTDCIFIRNLKLRLGSSQRDWNAQQSTISGGGCLTFGPLFLGGSHSSSSSDRSVSAHYTDQGVSIDGMQLFGVMGYELPQSPNPNPKVTSWI